MTEPPLAHILIADDEPLFLRTTAALLEEANYRCTCVADGDSARQALANERFDLILSDLNMPGNRRLEFLHQGRDTWPDTPLIVITGAPSLPSAIESVRLGISDYLLKPVKYDDLLTSIRRALRSRPRRGGADKPASAQPGQALFPEIVSQSPAMREVFAIMERVADADVNVLITGESGTGKEVVAAAIHRHSSRADHPFKVIDCTAIPETLFESVLFGHAKGAFTGAVRDHPGLLAEADGGTVFLDEIGELSLVSQAKLLRVIQQPSFTPLGQTQERHVNVRFLCATNRDLMLEVHGGRFRRDLFYRLAVLHIELPPLRERGDDVILLAEHFLRQLRRPDQAIEGYSPAAKELLLNYRWPGNVRELRNAVEHGLTMARSSEIEPGDLPGAIHSPDSAAAAESEREEPTTSRASAVRTAEHEYLESLLQRHHGNVARSAAEAGLSRQGLHKLLKKHGLDAAPYRTRPVRGN